MKIKNKIVSVCLFSGLSCSTFAAVVAERGPININAALELLKLPEQNRRDVIGGKPEVYYKPFLEIAFDEARGMNIRWRALMAAAEVNGGNATSDLKNAGSHSMWFMRNAALIALSEVNPAEGIKLAQKLVKDKALVVRSAAVDILKKENDPEVRELLWKELDQKYNFKGAQSLWIRHQIVEALSKSPKNAEFKTFAHLLTDKDASIHRHAIAGLEKLTGVKLEAPKNKSTDLVVLWKQYLVKEKIEL